jgi:hypothetical protein
MVVDKVESFRDWDSVGAWGSSITRFRSALGKGLGKNVSVLLISVVLRSLGVIGGLRGEVLDMPARVRDAICWFTPQGSETYRLQRVPGI